MMLNSDSEGGLPLLSQPTNSSGSGGGGGSTSAFSVLNALSAAPVYRSMHIPSAVSVGTSAGAFTGFGLLSATGGGSNPASATSSPQLVSNPAMIVTTAPPPFATPQSSGHSLSGRQSPTFGSGVTQSQGGAYRTLPTMIAAQSLPPHSSTGVHMHHTLPAGYGTDKLSLPMASLMRHSSQPKPTPQPVVKDCVLAPTGELLRSTNAALAPLPLLQQSSHPSHTSAAALAASAAASAATTSQQQHLHSVSASLLQMAHTQPASNSSAVAYPQGSPPLSSSTVTTSQHHHTSSTHVVAPLSQGRGVAALQKKKYTAIVCSIVTPTARAAAGLVNANSAPHAPGTAVPDSYLMASPAVLRKIPARCEKLTAAEAFAAEMGYTPDSDMNLLRAEEKSSHSSSSSSNSSASTSASGSGGLPLHMHLHSASSPNIAGLIAAATAGSNPAAISSTHKSMTITTAHTSASGGPVSITTSTFKSSISITSPAHSRPDSRNGSRTGSRSGSPTRGPKPIASCGLPMLRMGDGGWGGCSAAAARCAGYESVPTSPVVIIPVSSSSQPPTPSHGSSTATPNGNKASFPPEFALSAASTSTANTSLRLGGSGTSGGIITTPVISSGAEEEVIGAVPVSPVAASFTPSKARLAVSGNATPNKHRSPRLGPVSPAHGGGAVGRQPSVAGLAAAAAAAFAATVSASSTSVASSTTATTVHLPTFSRPPSGLSGPASNPFMLEPVSASGDSAPSTGSSVMTIHTSPARDDAFIETSPHAADDSIDADLPAITQLSIHRHTAPQATHNAAAAAPVAALSVVTPVSAASESRASDSSASPLSLLLSPSSAAVAVEVTTGTGVKN